MPAGILSVLRGHIYHGRPSEVLLIFRDRREEERLARLHDPHARAHTGQTAATAAAASCCANERAADIRREASGSFA